jgi:hypothetical protein
MNGSETNMKGGNKKPFQRHSNFMMYVSNKLSSETDNNILKWLVSRRNAT